MNFSNKFLFVAFLMALATPAFAANFTVNSNSTNTTAQTLNAGQTGTVNTSGTLAVTGNNVAISVQGNSTINNYGTIQQMDVLTGGNAGNSRAIRNSTGTLTLTVNNGSATNSTALIQTADGDIIQMKVAGSNVTFNNYGTLNSQNSSGGGNQVIDWNGLTTGSNTLNNYSTGIITASEADAVRPGVNGVVYNYGTIKSTSGTGSSSDGIDAQNNTGATITNYSTGLIEGARHGITGGALSGTVTFTTTVTNNSGGVIQGDNGSGINLDGFNANQTATIVNNGTITGNGHYISADGGLDHDGDGVDVDGLVNLTNTGTIRSINSYNTLASGTAYSEGVTAGGGTIVNSGTIEGDVAAGNTNATGRGISLLGNDSLTQPGTREPIYGNAVVTNQTGGLIRGQTDSGICVGGSASGFTVTITNQAGATIQGGGPTAAIQTGADNDTINNSGTIKADSSGKAIDMGAGNNTLNILGGAASVVGDISGGISAIGATNMITIDPGAGNTFSYTGNISNFSTALIQSGRFNLSGVMTSGSTILNAAVLAGSGTVGGLVVVTSGTISPGNSPGKLTLQTGLDLSGGGKYLWQLASLNDGTSGVAGTNFDQILLTGGNLTLGGSSLLMLDFSLLNGADPNSSDAFWNTDHSWTVIAATGTTNIGSTNFSAISDPSYIHGNFTTSTDVNGDVLLEYYAVPEPSTVWLLTASLLLLAGNRLRLRRQA